MSKVIFYKSAKTDPGTSLARAAKEADVKLPIHCNKGKCGKCAMKMEGELNPVTKEELKLLSSEELSKGYRLACMVVVQGDAKVKLKK